jgi:hypothetical protein
MVMRRYRSTLLLLLAVAVAGVVAHFVGRGPTSEELQKQRKRIFADFDADAVQELVIREGEQRLVCRRDQGGEWRLAEPLNLRADRWEVQSILGKLETAERVSYVYPEKGEALDLAAYGLEEPLRAVTARAGNRTWTMSVGREAGVADSVYVAVEGRDAVMAVPQDVARKTDVTVTDLRSKRIAPRLNLLDLEKVAASAAPLADEPAYELECERSDGAWQIKAPFHDLADREALRSFVNKLYDHRIGEDDFVADDPTRAAEYGLDEPDLTLTLDGEDASQTVVLSRQGEGDGAEHYAMHKGERSIVRVAQSLFDGLRAEPSELRERSLVDFATEDAAELTLLGPRGELVLEKAEGDWQIAGDEPTPADQTLTDDLLRGLKHAEVAEFVADAPSDLGAFGLDEGERLSVRVFDEEGEELAEAAFGAPTEDGDRIYALRPPYPAVLAVEKADYVDALLTGRLALLDRLVLEEPREEAVEVVTRGPDGGFTCVRNAAEEPWKLEEPVEGQADRWAVQAIVGDFARLRVERFAAEEADDLTAYGLETPETVVSVAYRQEAVEGEEPERRVRTLEVGAEADGGRYARLADDARLFVLADYVVDRLTANLASKQICRAADLRRLTVRRGEQEARFSYATDAGAWTDADGAELPEPLKEAVREADWLLRSFTAAEVADYVEKAPALYGFDEPYLVVEFDEKTAEGKRVVIGSELEDGNRYAKGPATSFVHVARGADVETLTAVLESPEAEAAEAGAPEEAAAED